MTAPTPPPPHTPGPWRRTEDEIISAGGSVVAYIRIRTESDDLYQTSLANADLIARAPALEAEVERLTEHEAEAIAFLVWLDMKPEAFEDGGQPLENVHTWLLRHFGSETKLHLAQNHLVAEAKAALARESAITVPRSISGNTRGPPADSREGGKDRVGQPAPGRTLARERPLPRAVRAPIPLTDQNEKEAGGEGP